MASCLLVIVVAATVLTAAPGKLIAHAARTTPSPAEVFWRAALPGAPMPEAIRELLHHGAAVDHGMSKKKKDDDDKPPLPPLDFKYNDYKAASRRRNEAPAPPAEVLTERAAGAGDAPTTVFFPEDAVRVGASIPLLDIPGAATAGAAEGTAAAAAPALPELLRLYTVRAVRAVEGPVGGRFVVCRHESGGGGAVYGCRVTARSFGGGGGPARAYVVDAAGEGGDAVTAAVVCHTGASGWAPARAAFRLLDVAPGGGGGAAVCHEVPGALVVPARDG